MTDKDLIVVLVMTGFAFVFGLIIGYVIGKGKTPC